MPGVVQCGGFNAERFPLGRRGVIFFVLQAGRTFFFLKSLDRIDRITGMNGQRNPVHPVNPVRDSLRVRPLAVVVNEV